MLAQHRKFVIPFLLPPILSLSLPELAKAETASNPDSVQKHKFAPAPVTLKTTDAAKTIAAPLAASPRPQVSAAAEQLVVTGSRSGARRVEDSLTPIALVTSADIKKTGKQTLRDALAELFPSYTSTAGYQGQQGEAVRTARLRGLDSKDTLILVDGKRRHKTSLFISGESPTDLDMIPMSAVDHIEILEDGAAAQYGSDAIAGVINIVLKKNAKGGAASFGYGQYGSTVGDQSDLWGRTGTIQFNQGFDLGPEGSFFSLSGNIDIKSPTNVYGSYPLSSRIYPKLSNGQLDPREYSMSRFRQIEGQPAARNFSFAYNTAVPLNDSVVFYSNATFDHRNSDGYLFYRTAISPQNFPWIYPDGYMPLSSIAENDYQAVFGFKGKDFFGWKWDVSSSYGSDRAQVYTLNSLNPSLGRQYENKHNFYDGSLINGEWVNNFDLSRKFDTGLFSRPLSVSLGIEHRRETFNSYAGEWASYEDGSFIWPAGGANAGIAPNPGASGMKGFDPKDVGGWSRNNAAVYAELNQKITDKLTLDIAGRYEYWTDFGSAPIGKISGRYDFNKKFALRGTISNGFSAPTLQQEHYTQSTGGYVTNPTTGQLYQQYTVQASPTSAIANALGAQALKPEHSLNASLGFVTHPLPRTTFTVDGYVIDIRNRIIITPTLQGSTVTRVLNAAGIYNVTGVTLYTNAAHTLTKGFDVRLEHFEKLGKWGTLRWTLVSDENNTSIIGLSGIPSALAGSGIGWGRSVTSQLTSWYPKNVTTLAQDWQIGNWDLMIKEYRWSSTNYKDANGPQLDQHNAAAFTTDINVSYRVNSNMTVVFGANNVTNKRPTQWSASTRKYASVPISNPAYNWYSPYGNDGGYYYARLDAKW
ncbi:MAG: TonB-dependent receptor [Acetobacter sp.]|uniref:TonB-dependent receptor plug domain-containing protein n=1 Tax=Acetobacter sp. TaxID=440 RepID=UPI0039E79A37